MNKKCASCGIDIPEMWDLCDPCMKNRVRRELMFGLGIV
jgi:hypothetical protein